MKNRVSKEPGRYNAALSAEDRSKMEAGQPFYITLARDDDPTEPGTPYNKESVLPDDVAEAICPDIADPTPADAFRALANRPGGGDPTALQDELRQLADVRSVERISASAVTYGYNFVAGNKYRITNKSTSYVTIRIQDANGANVKMQDKNGAEVDKLSITVANPTSTFTANGDAVTLYLYFGGTGSVEIEDLSRRVPVVEEIVSNLQNEAEHFHRQNELSDFSWTVGTMNAGTGQSDNTTTKRIRTGFIPITGCGSTVVFDGNGSFIVCEYASNNELSCLNDKTGVSANWLSDRYTVQKDSCKYIRIAARINDSESFVDSNGSVIESKIKELGNSFKLIQQSFTHRTVGRYVSPVKENFHYDGELEAYSLKLRLAELYSKWDALQEANASVVTKTVLGTVTDSNGVDLEIRSYRITPPQMNPSYRIARYSCDPLKILYVSSIHGGEGAIALDDFTMFKNLVENHKPSILWDNCVFEIIPVANPIGYDTQSRYNGNGVNINRNFPYNWLYVDKDVDPYNGSGEVPCDQYETQLLMEFVKSNPDAFLVMNRHGTADWGNGGLAGYAASAYQSDIETIIASDMATDTMLRDMDVYAELINAKNPNTRIFSTLHNDMFNGSFDSWYNSIGQHGYLLEYTDRFDGETEANDTVRRINIAAIMNLLCDSVVNNRGILENNNKLPGRELAP